MPLLDHFHPPLSEERHWESFLSAWANEIVAALNQGRLPPGHVSETQVHFGGRAEVNVASFPQVGSVSSESLGGGAVQTSTAPLVLLMPAVFPDEVEVQVFRSSGGTSLVGAIELISPANKDRPESRRAFATKCAAYLQLGIGLIIVDIVTERQMNLHDELVQLLGQSDAYRFPFHSFLYTVAYRPLRSESAGDQIAIQPIPLVLGQDLPTMPLALRGGPTVSIDLESTYSRTRQRAFL
jgi:hypothetical protein